MKELKLSFQLIQNKSLEQNPAFFYGEARDRGRKTQHNKC